MADLLERLDALPADRRAVALRLLLTRAAELDVAPLSYAQRQVWLHEQMYGSTTVYNTPFAFWLTGTVDTMALEAALAGIVRRHEALRTRYFEVDGVPYQVVVPPADRPVQLGVRHWRPADSANASLVRRVLDLEARAPFDLRRGPLLRARILSAADRHLFLLSLHHIVCDGWSMAIIFQELAQRYAAARSGQELRLPAVAPRYLDFVRRQSADLVGSVDHHQKYWLDQLAGAPAVLDFPAGLPRVPAEAPPGEAIDVRWDGDVASDIHRTVRRLGGTTYLVMLAGFAALLYRQSGLGDMVIGTPVANRATVEAEQLVGMFVNTVPLRLRPSGEMTFSALVRHAATVVLDAQEHQELPFEQLVEALQPPRTLTHNPVFQVLFTVQDSSFDALQLAGLDVASVHGHNGTSKVDLTLMFEVGATQVDANVEYDIRRFDQQTATGLLDQLRCLLVAAAADPDRTLDALPLDEDTVPGSR